MKIKNIMKVGGETLGSQVAWQGKIGISSGEGFYEYPNPAFNREDFLSR